MRIRSLTEDDIEVVAGIEAMCYAPPWSAEDFAAELRRRGDWTSVAAAPGVIGYLVSSVVVDELHIQKVTTHPDHRRAGVARALVSDVLRRARDAGVRTAQLEVRKDNIAARMLYESYGFVIDGSRPGYYADGETAVLMSRALG